MNIYSAIHRLFRYYVQAPSREDAAQLVAGHPRWAVLSMVEVLTPDALTLRMADVDKQPRIIRREPLFVVVRYCGMQDADTPEDELPPECERGTCWRDMGHACGGHEVILDYEYVPQMSAAEAKEQRRVSIEHHAWLLALRYPKECRSLAKRDCGSIRDAVVWLDAREA